MTKLKFFDCNCSIGRPAYPHLLDISDVAGLTKEMNTAGVEQALVYHIVARDGYPSQGNAMLLDEIKVNPSLFPVYVVLPHHTDEMPDPEKLLRDMKNNNVKAARIYPKVNYHNFSLAKWSVGDLLSALESERIPLLLDMETVTWEDVHSMLADHPEMPVVAANCTYRNDRYIYPLMEKHKNFYVELSRFMGAGTVEDVVRKFGSKNLLFGTNMPQYTGTAVIPLITYGEFDHAAKQNIACDNLTRILDEVWK